MLNKLTIKKIHEGLVKKEFSSQEITKSCLDAISKKDQDLEAFLEVYKEDAMRESRRADDKIVSGEKINFLEGIPFAVKDNIAIFGKRVSAGSKILENYISPYSATVINKLREAGAVILGKTNLDEFACGSSTENSAFQITKNPYDLERVAGGSSGGSVAAVSSDEVIFALGSDTGGSIRQPASFCGVVGFKPTYGRISRFGLLALGSSLDVIGPITKTVEDAAYVLEELAGKDKKDSTTFKNKPQKYSKHITKEIKGLKIGLPEEYFVDKLNENIKKIIFSVVDKYKKMGAQIINITLPHTQYALFAYYIIMPSELSSNLARYDGVKYGFSGDGDNLLDVYLNSRSEGFGAEIKRRVMLGTYTLSAGYYDAYYKKALAVRELIKKDFFNAFKKVDAILTPTTPDIAFRVGEKSKDPIKMYLEDIFTVSANLAGIPAISIPCGKIKSENGNEMPIGFQLLGRHFEEEIILTIGHQYEIHHSFL